MDCGFLSSYFFFWVSKTTITTIINIVKKLGPQQHILPRGIKETGKYDLASKSMAGVIANIKDPP
jgi:hypothetical protein